MSQTTAAAPTFHPDMTHDELVAYWLHIGLIEKPEDVRFVDTPGYRLFDPADAHLLFELLDTPMQAEAHSPSP